MWGGRERVRLSTALARGADPHPSPPSPLQASAIGLGDGQVELDTLLASMAGDGYDAAALAAGLKGRRVEVAARAARVLAAAASFGATLAADAATGALEANAPLRAGQLRDALASLGPSFVKVGVVSGGVVRVRVTFFQGE